VPDPPQEKKENNIDMKNKNEKEMQVEYDFNKGTRGKYAKSFKLGTNIIVLEPDVAKIFPDSAAVNEVLRAVAKVALRAK
jgi:hypothetical protein